MSAATTPEAGRRPAFRAASPLLFDVAVPVGLYYLLSAAGVADTPALIVSGLVPFARSVYGVLRAGKADYLAVMMAALQPQAGVRAAAPDLRRAPMRAG